MLRLMLLLVIVGVPGRAFANSDVFPINYSIGPVLAVGLQRGAPVIFGIEGGVGMGPERINLGFEHRPDHEVGYIELDPWFFLGGTFGVAVDETGSGTGVVGLWEGWLWQASNVGCSDPRSILTIAAGWRYTGVHELFVTVKGGRSEGAALGCGDGQ